MIHDCGCETGSVCSEGFTFRETFSSLDNFIFIFYILKKFLNNFYFKIIYDKKFDKIILLPRNI